eukprot:6264191-Pyramimonas_sp.AAC.1
MARRNPHQWGCNGEDHYVESVMICLIDARCMLAETACFVLVCPPIQLCQVRAKVLPEPPYVALS